MKKIRAQIEKIEGERVYIKYDDSQVILPSSLVGDFRVGDTVVITLATEKEDSKDSSEVAKALLTDILKEE